MNWDFMTTRDPVKGNATIHARMELDHDAQLMEFLNRKTVDMLIEAAVSRWIEEHGAELLAKITPEEVEQRVKQSLAERVLGAK
jgi:hypothetical protein